MTAPLPDYRLVRSTRPAPKPPVLDEAQLRVARHDRGRLHVLAGPGTGKTTTLVEAAVERVRRGVPVEHLLMLTFGRRAAAELRDRITARLGRTVREPVARTMHSYAFGVLRMAAVRQQLPAPRLLAGAEQDVILRELVAGDVENASSAWPPELAPALHTRAFAEQLRDLLMRAVERGLAGPDLARLGRRHGRADWVAAGAFLTQYQDVTALGRPGAYDPAELMQAALGALQDDPELLAAERARRRRIFVDEYQDTDPAQAALLALLADGADELVVVGDRDQSIYGFRGAEPAALDGILDGAEVVALQVSRRSGAALLAAGRRVAAALPGPQRHRDLRPAPGLPAGQVEVRLLRTASEEAGHIAATLRRAHLDGMPWSRMAVLVRSTEAALPVLRRALVTAGVPLIVRGEDVPLAEQTAVATLLTAVRAALHPERLAEDGAEALLLSPLGGADAMSVRRLRRELRGLAAAAGQPADVLLLAPALLDLPGATVLPTRVRGPVERVARALAAGRNAVAASATPEQVLWSIWEASGLAGVWERASRAGGGRGDAADRDLDAVVELFAAAARFTDRLPAAPITVFVEHLAAQQIPGESRGAQTDGLPGGSSEAVSVLTAHGSKGLEWDLVCVAGVQEGRWPDLRRRGSLLGAELLADILAGRHDAGNSSVLPQLAEERRLFYVAVTRARRRLVVTAVSGEDEQPSRFLDELLPGSLDVPVAVAPPAAHLADLVARLRAAASDPALPATVHSDATGELARLAAGGVPGAHPDEWWGLAPVSDAGPLADPSRPVAISPSRIEAFVRCELKSVLEHLGGRDDEAGAASLGTVIHQAAAAAPDGGIEELSALVDEQWPALEFRARWVAVNERAKAQDMLVRLSTWLRDSRRELTLVAVEQPFEVQIGDAVLTGSVDRLERDGSGRLVVIDLKTGSTVAKDADVVANPQLGAYQTAVAHGALGGDGAVPGGGRLVQLAKNIEAKVQPQPALGDATDPGWIDAQITNMAQRLRGSQFHAVLSTQCDRCGVRACCPLRPEGRQVTS